MAVDNMFLVGVKDVPYIDKQGKQKRAREIHVMYEEEQTDGFRGNKVDSFFVSFDVSQLPLQKWYEPKWSVTKFQGRQEARLSGLIITEE